MAFNFPGTTAAYGLPPEWAPRVGTGTASALGILPGGMASPGSAAATGAAGGGLAALLQNPALLQGLASLLGSSREENTGMVDIGGGMMAYLPGSKAAAVRQKQPAPLESALSAMAMGQLEQLAKKEGQKLRKGEKMDDREYERSLKMADREYEAGLKAAEKAEQARRDRIRGILGLATETGMPVPEAAAQYDSLLSAAAGASDSGRGSVDETIAAIDARSGASAAPAGGAADGLAPKAAPANPIQSRVEAAPDAVPDEMPIQSLADVLDITGAGIAKAGRAVGSGIAKGAGAVRTGLENLAYEAEYNRQMLMLPRESRISFPEWLAEQMKRKSAMTGQAVQPLPVDPRMTRLSRIMVGR